MGHCVLLIDDPLLEDIYSLNLKMYTDTDALVKRSCADVKSLFEHIPAVDLIIARDNEAEVSTALEIYEFLKDTGRDYIPIIVLGNKKYTFANVLDPKADVSKLIKLAAKLLGITAKDIANRLMPEFLPIPLSHFQNLDTVNIDVFKRSSEENGNSMYYKCFEAHRPITAKDIENVRKMGHRHLYIMSGERLKFTNFFTRQVVLKVREEKDPAKKNQLLQQAVDFVRSEASSTLNLSEETLEVANVAIEETLNMIEKSNALKHFMKTLLENTSGFGFQHCQMITYVAFHIIEKMEWGSKEQQQKLSFVAFFHDIVLQEEDHIKIHSQLDFDSTELDERSKKLITNHAYLACDLVSRIPNAPMGADQVIKQHHGAYNGVGFPKEYHHALSPLAIVFMVAEEFVHNLLKNKDSFDFAEGMARIRRKFPNSGKWKQTITTLESLNNL